MAHHATATGDPGLPSTTMSVTEPFCTASLSALFKRRVAERRDHPFLVWRDLDGGRREWTYSETADLVDRLAASLWAKGVRAGHRVAVHADNAPEFIWAWFAIAELGAVIVATNVRSSVDELRDYLARAGCSIVFTDAERLDVVQASRRADVSTVVFDVTNTVGDVTGAEKLSDWLEAEPRTDSAPVTVAAPAGIQFTSGTTGRAKGVVWTQANYLWAGRVGATHLELTEDDRFLLYLPLFHANAQSYVVLPTVWAGGTLILMPRFSASRFWPVSVEEEATVASMIPFSVKALRSHDVPAHHSYRVWGNGIIVPSWERRFSAPTVSWWGMTETVTQPIVSKLGEPGHPLAMGRCAPEYEVRIVDDAGHVLEAPAVGLLEVKGERGVSLFAEYLDDPEATDATFTDDGWLKTGDRVEAHEDGWFSFVERDKDMLKIGAENVAAQEIERVAGAVPGVSEVAVVAAPDRMLDEIPVAFVVPADDAPDDLADQVVQRCREELADFKVPRHVAFLDALPQSLLGKTAKNVLRERAADLVKPARA